jgi:hypothetical protein
MRHCKQVITAVVGSRGSPVILVETTDFDWLTEQSTSNHTARLRWTPDLLPTGISPWPKNSP